MERFQTPRLFTAGDLAPMFGVSRRDDLPVVAGVRPAVATGRAHDAPVQPNRRRALARAGAAIVGNIVVVLADEGQRPTRPS